MQTTDFPFFTSSAVAAKPEAPAPITTTSGLDCEKEILGNVTSANPDREVFMNCLLPIFFIIKCYQNPILINYQIILKSS